VNHLLDLIRVGAKSARTPTHSGLFRAADAALIQEKETVRVYIVPLSCTHESLLS
jgi:hypothetical protein